MGLSSLDSWTPKSRVTDGSLLAEYHNIFSLDSCKLGCMDLAWHTIKVMDDEPFRWIPPPMVEEVQAHVKEMLEAGTICPRQRPWCTAVVLVRKKDRSLHLCIDFWQSNACMKTDSYPLSHIQEVMVSLVGVGHFSCLDLKSVFWQAKMDEESKQYMAFTVGNLGFFKCEWMPFWLCNAPVTFQQLMQNCLGEMNLTYCLIYLDDMIILSKMEE